MIREELEYHDQFRAPQRIIISKTQQEQADSSAECQFIQLPHSLKT